MKKFGKVLKKKLKQLIVAKKNEYGKDLKKNRFEFNDDLPLNKTIKLGLLTIIIRPFLVKLVNFTVNYF